MTRDQRLRRCLLLCCHFARNLAYYRARRMVDLAPCDDFWISADANFIDVAILKWCKILGDTKAEQGWKKVLTDPERFQNELLNDLKMNADQWQEFILHIRHYRDKFLAHLDSELVMNIPELDRAFQSAKFYYHWILKYEYSPLDRAKIPPTLDGFYGERLREAEGIYDAISIKSPRQPQQTSQP